jgi:uncharacterized protein YjiS (DUF1127 family)
MTQLTFPALAAAPMYRIASGTMAALRSIRRSLADSWRYSVARRDFDAVDDTTLRDLGISRAEFDSYWAEAEGLVERTRLRVMQDLGPGYRL